MRKRKGAERMRTARRRPAKLYSDSELTQVTTRLFADDVGKIRVLAAKERIGWQLKLRLIVSDALRARRVVA